MKNKKILIAIIVVLVLIAITAIGILVLKNSEEKDSIKEDNTSKVVEKNEVTNTKNDEKDVDYKGIIKKFLVACDSEDDMDDFVDEYVDIKSLYVINSVGSFSEFMDEYEKTKSKDYKDYIDDVKEQFADFVDSEEKIKLLNVEKPRSMSEIDIDIWKDVRFTVEIDDEEYELAAIFCDNKVVEIVNASIVDAWYKLDENSAKGTANDALSTALASISTDFYISEDYENSSLIEMVTEDRLTELAPGYEFTITEGKENDSEILNITMKKDGYTFVAEVSETLVIKSFELKD